MEGGAGGDQAEGSWRCLELFERAGLELDRRARNCQTGPLHHRRSDVDRRELDRERCQLPRQLARTAPDLQHAGAGVCGQAGGFGHPFNDHGRVALPGLRVEIRDRVKQHTPPFAACPLLRRLDLPAGPGCHGPECR